MKVVFRMLLTNVLCSWFSFICRLDEGRKGAVANQMYYERSRRPLRAVTSLNTVDLLISCVRMLCASRPDVTRGCLCN